MKRIERVYSSFIRKSMVSTPANSLLERIMGIFFRSIDLDAVSLKTIEDFRGKGRFVYASFQSAYTPLLIFTGLLRRHGHPAPELALDFIPGPIQSIEYMMERAALLWKKLSGKVSVEKIDDFECIFNYLSESRPIALSLLSRKLFFRRYIEVKADSIEYLVEAQKRIEEPIFLFPQIMFWNQNPERTRALMTAQATGDRGFLSGLFTLMRSVTPAFVRVLTPINLKEEIEQSPQHDTRQIARKVRSRLLELYGFEKRSVLGPVLKSQSEMMERVLEHRNVLEEIRILHETEHASERKLRKKAYRYFKEIAADFSIFVIKWFHWSVRLMFTKIFDGIYYDIDELKRVKEASLKAPLILVPSHKSHMDYLIVSSIFYENKMIPPHIVAGANLTFFPMGPIFRHSGAFFMRRSFKGLKLYPTIFKQYIKTLVGEGYSVEFFIEGGRSRTGKVMMPKMGILKYLLDAIDEGYNRDLMLVPITINYDRILEESSYHLELKGKEKERESTANFVKSSSLLRRKYGKVYLAFNEPVSLQEFRERLPEGKDLMEALSYHLVAKIAEIVVVTPFSLVTAAMLQSSARGFTRDLIKKRIKTLYEYLAFAKVRMVDQLTSMENFDSIIDYTIDSYAKDGIVGEALAGGSGEAQVVEGLYIINENERSRINFYKNTILHYFTPVSFISLTLIAADGVAEESSLKENFAELQRLFSREFIYPDSFRDSSSLIERNCAYLEGQLIVSRGEGRVAISDNGKDDIALFAKGLQDFLESYFIVFDCVAQSGSRMSRRELIHEIRKNGIRLFHLGDVKLPESLSMPNYENALAFLEDQGLVTTTTTGRTQQMVDVKNLDGIKALRTMVEKYLKPLQKQ